MTAPTAAESLVAEARRLLEGTVLTSDGMATRAAALLARQALEQRCRERLDPLADHIDGATLTAQFLALAAVTDDDEVPRRAAYVWSALSTVTHHRGYELPPTAVELHAWIDDVEAILQTLAS